MTLGVLGAGYAAIGVAIALAVAIWRGVPPLADAVMLVVMWPVWGPLTIARADVDPRERALVEALARAKSSPLAAMLPDAESVRVLGARLVEASRRLGDLDVLLARPDFDPAAAEARARDLAARGALAAAATAELRVRTLGQLRALRERYRAELDEVHELIAQLVTQAELVRLQPAMAHSSAELVRELVARVEGLGELFTEYDSALGRSG